MELFALWDILLESDHIGFIVVSTSLVVCLFEEIFYAMVHQLGFFIFNCRFLGNFRPHYDASFKVIGFTALPVLCGDSADVHYLGIFVECVDLVSRVMPYALNFDHLAFWIVFLFSSLACEDFIP